MDVSGQHVTSLSGRFKGAGRRVLHSNNSTGIFYLVREAHSTSR